MHSNLDNDLPMSITDENTGLHYTLHGDYYLPDLGIEEQKRPISRWAVMRMDYLKKNHPIYFNQLLLSGKLGGHIAMVAETAETLYTTLLKGYVRCWEITEELKSTDPMKWVGLMNMARAEAENMVMTEIICD